MMPLIWRNDWSDGSFPEPDRSLIHDIGRIYGIYQAGTSLPVSSYNRVLLSGVRRNQGGDLSAPWAGIKEYPVPSAGILYGSDNGGGIFKLWGGKGDETARTASETIRYVCIYRDWDHCGELDF